MHKYVIALLAFSVPVVAQTATHHPTASAAKKPATAAAAHPTAIIDTTAGKLTCTLFPDKAPLSVKNFIGLAKGTKDWINPANGKNMHGVPLYNGTIFHRVIPNFMIQGGDPLGSGMGSPEGPGFPVKNETSPDLTFDRPGRLAYANSGPNTNGSQFFITEVPYPSLDGNYSIFGQCDDPSVEIVKKIARLPRNANDKPDDPPKISKIMILGGSAVHHTPAHKAGTPAAKPPRQPTRQQ